MCDFWYELLVTWLFVVVVKRRTYDADMRSGVNRRRFMSSPPRRRPVSAGPLLGPGRLVAEGAGSVVATGPSPVCSVTSECCCGVCARLGVVAAVSLICRCPGVRFLRPSRVFAVAALESTLPLFSTV